MRFHQAIFAVTVVAAGLAFATGPSHAAALAFSDIGPKKTFAGTTKPYLISGPAGDGPTTYFASQFTALAGGSLAYLDMPLASVTSGGQLPGALVVLVPDAQGLPSQSGAAMEQWLVTKLPAYDSHAAPKVTKITSKKHPVLTAGAKYWVIVLPPGYDTTTFWYLNSVSAKLNDAVSQNGASELTQEKPWISVPQQAAPAYDVWIQ